MHTYENLHMLERICEVNENENALEKKVKILLLALLFPSHEKIRR